MSRLTVLGVLAVLAMVCGSALADDAYVGSLENPVLFGDYGPPATYQATHDDAAPNKGWAYITVKNSGSTPWTDFHFQITDVGGGSVALLDIVNSTEFPVSSSETLGSVVVNNDVTGSTLDIYFAPGSTVTTGEVLTVQFYTDNTVSLADYWGLCMYPTVPEPACLGLLALGVLGLIRRR